MPAFGLGADLVVESVSPNKPQRAMEEKRWDEAATGIPEAPIVNPLTDTITVLVFDGESYAEHGVFHRGDRAGRKLLAGLNVSVDGILDAA